MGYIGADRNATMAAASIHVPQGMFMPPLPPPHHCYLVCTNFVYYLCKFGISCTVHVQYP